MHKNATMAHSKCMMKMLSLYLLWSILSVVNIGGYAQPMELKDFFAQATGIYCLVEGKETKCNTWQFKEIVNCLEQLLTADGSYEMPAFGVSMHKLTIEQMKQGVWLRFVYEKEHMHNNMPFTELLIKVEPSYAGFNIIRKYNGEYTGRCFYYQTPCTMQSLWELLKTFSF